MEPQNTTPIMPQTPQQGASDRAIGPAIGIIVIIALIVLGGLYFLSQRTTVQNSTQENAESQNEVPPGADLDALQTQNSSDDVDSIEADLNATNVTDLGTEIESVQ
jgi:uncharacterized protein HemX